MKSFDRYLVKFFYLAVFTSLIVTAFLVGCGGSNNPAGPTSITAGSTTTGAGLQTGTSSIIGKVVTNNGTPVGNLLVKLYFQNQTTGTIVDTTKSMTTLTSGEFSFNGLGTGTYILRIDPTTEYSEASKLAVVGSEPSVNTGNFVVYEKNTLSAGTSSISGVVVTEDQKPAANIIVKLLVYDFATNSYTDTTKTMTTLTTGEFTFSGLGNGTYILKIEETTDYFEATKLAIISQEGIVSTGNFVISAKNNLSAGNASLIGKVVTGNQIPIAGMLVKLFIQDDATGLLTDTNRSMVTLTSGEFNFNGLYHRTFVLKIDETASFFEASKLAIVSSDGTLDTGDFVVTAKNADSTIPTLGIKGKVIDPLSGAPLSVAQISLDSGQSTVTDAMGLFTLNNVASGTRKLTINQPGIVPYEINFEVRGTTPPNADAIYFNNELFSADAGGMVDDLILSGNEIKVIPNLHHSGTLLGTVKQFVLNNEGYPTSVQQAYPNYEFDIWQINITDGTARRFGSIVSATDGTWRVDQLPPFEDNGFLWAAVPVNTLVSVQQGQTGNVVAYANSSAVWANREPVLAYGYKVAAGETTVMDFTVPAFVYSSITSSVSAITDAGFSVNAAPKTTDTTALITDDLTFTWTGPGTSTEVILEFSRIYTNPTTPVVNKSFKFTASASTDTHSYNFKPSTLGLDYGRFTWLTKAIDPFKENTEAISDSYLFTVRPGAADMTPTGNIKIQPATYTVQFVAPTDPEAAYAILELYDNSGAMVGRANEVDFTNQATFNLTWGPNAPAAGNYTWRIRYYYNDGPPMDSESANISFVP